MVDTDGTEITSVGEQLRSAREAKGLTLEEVAAHTRIPRRHLESLETGDWAQLPAPTYTMGFAKSYASTVGLDRSTIGDQLRAEMGGARSATSDAEIFEAADPARTMPKWLVLGAILGIILLVAAFSLLNRRSLEGTDSPEAVAESEPAATNVVVAEAAAAPVAQGPVVITANEAVWVQIYERGGRTLFMGELAAGQRFDVPADVSAPLLRTGKPESLRISVGTADAPPVGPAATTVRDVSLLGPDLMRGSGSAPPAPQSSPAAPAQP